MNIEQNLKSSLHVSFEKKIKDLEERLANLLLKSEKSEQYFHVLMGLLDARDDEIKKMRLALKFYAEDDDHGQKARDALEGLK